MRRERLLLLRSGYHKDFAIRSLIEEGYDLIIVDEPNSQLLPFAHKMYTINDIWDEDEMTRLAIKAFAENSCSGALNFQDSSAIAYGRLSDHFNLNYYSEETGRILANKLRVRDVLTKSGLNSVKYACVRTSAELFNAIETLGLPAVVKPSDRTASKGVIILRDKNEIEQAYRESIAYSKNGDLIVEQFIYGEEFCSELMVVDSKTYLMSVSEKRVSDTKYCVEMRDLTPARLSSDMYDRIDKYLSRVIKELDYKNGIVHIEFKIDNSCINIIEVNPRCAGGNLLESVFHLSGYNPYTNLAHLVCHRHDAFRLPASIRDDGRYTLFDEMFYGGKPGVIKSIRNMSAFNDLRKHDVEKMFLYVDKGDYIGNAKNNVGGIGCIYLIDDDYNTLVERCNEIEGTIDIGVDEETI